MNPYLYIEPNKEQVWREKVKATHPKAEIRSNGAGTLLATLPGLPYWKSKIGHYKARLGGWVLRKGVKL